MILAGGDGKRLLPLTRKITGDDTPKQFCALDGGATLLDCTRQRVLRVVTKQNTLFLLTRTHERFYKPQLAGLPGSSLLVQPHGNGTAPAIAYAVTRLSVGAPDDIVGFFPSDHHFACEESFVASLDDAFGRAELDGERVVLLGIAPNSAESSYGWIQPGAELHRRGETPVFQVQRFWEKPCRDSAQRLLDAGCLWNSFVMVGRVSAFLNMLRRSLPDLVAAFESMWALVEPGKEHSALPELFANIPATNFSDDVLSVCTSHLSVMAVRGTGWTDLGEPERALSILPLQTIGTSGFVQGS
ncbi:MAG TPA: sugar phosphate nucleotidyltransferase [Bryobacteraceae bacterium]|nr:sugar phosphate nucleotidyltransferase [Bryobacteraceae bacterium]